MLMVASESVNRGLTIVLRDPGLVMELLLVVPGVSRKELGCGLKLFRSPALSSLKLFRIVCKAFAFWPNDSAKASGSLVWQFACNSDPLSLQTA